MIKRLCTSEGWHKARLHLTRCGFRILAALALLLVGANPSVSAQAAPANGNFTLVMTAYPSAKYVCVGGTMYLRVEISVQVDAQPGATKPDLEKVRASYINAEVSAGEGTITPPTSSLFGRRRFIPAPQSIPEIPRSSFPDSVMFTFTAGENPGTASINFKSIVSRFWLGDGRVFVMDSAQTIGTTATIDVRKCGYKVEMLFQEPLYSLGLLTGIAKEVRLNQVSDTVFSGDVDLNLSLNFTPGLGCPITAQIPPVKLEYDADLAGDRLYLTVNFASFKGTVTTRGCGDLPTTGSQSIETPPGSATVVVPSKGGLGVLSTPYWTYMFIVTKISE